MAPRALFTTILREMMLRFLLRFRMQFATDPSGESSRSVYVSDSLGQLISMKLGTCARFSASKSNVQVLPSGLALIWETLVRLQRRAQPAAFLRIAQLQSRLL